jgi:hypothetical protein
VNARLGRLQLGLVARAQVLWLLSPMLELSEVSFQHVLPNFKECVWDSWGLDIFTFNAFGIWAGYRVLRSAGLPQYDLLGLQVITVAQHPGCADYGRSAWLCCCSRAARGGRARARDSA